MIWALKIQSWENFPTVPVATLKVLGGERSRMHCPAPSMASAERGLWSWHREVSVLTEPSSCFSLQFFSTLHLLARVHVHVFALGSWLCLAFSPSSSSCAYGFSSQPSSMGSAFSVHVLACLYLVVEDLWQFKCRTLIEKNKHYLFVSACWMYLEPS